MNSYPIEPGHKVVGPSEEAAKAISGIASTLRDQVRRIIATNPGGLTADEIAHKLNRSILSVRPRVSELRRLGEIKQSGSRGKNESGMSATIWVAAPSLNPEKLGGAA
jgi:DNA-binding IclR family transcriptional regulator